MTFTDFQWLFTDEEQHRIPWLFKSWVKFDDFSSCVWTLWKNQSRISLKCRWILEVHANVFPYFLTVDNKQYSRHVFLNLYFNHWKIKILSNCSIFYVYSVWICCLSHKSLPAQKALVGLLVSLFLSRVLCQIAGWILLSRRLTIFGQIFVYFTHFQGICP